MHLDRIRIDYSIKSLKSCVLYQQPSLQKSPEIGQNAVNKPVKR